MFAGLFPLLTGWAWGSPLGKATGLRAHCFSNYLGLRLPVRDHSSLVALSPMPAGQVLILLADDSASLDKY